MLGVRAVKLVHVLCWGWLELLCSLVDRLCLNTLRGSLQDQPRRWRSFPAEAEHLFFYQPNPNGPHSGGNQGSLGTPNLTPPKHGATMVGGGGVNQENMSGFALNLSEADVQALRQEVEDIGKESRWVEVSPAWGWGSLCFPLTRQKDHLLLGS